jgi:hypothetical protein
MWEAAKKMRLEEVLNQSPEEKIVQLLNCSQKTVWMSSSVQPDFFNKNDVKEAMEKASRRVSAFHLLLSSEVDWETRRQALPWLVALENENKITIKKSKEMIPHWLFADGKNFRLEKGHLEEKPLMTNNLVIWNATKPIAEMLQAKYEQWWNQSNSVI